MSYLVVEGTIESTLSQDQPDLSAKLTTRQRALHLALRDVARAQDQGKRSTMELASPKLE